MNKITFAGLVIAVLVTACDNDSQSTNVTQDVTPKDNATTENASPAFSGNTLVDEKMTEVESAVDDVKQQAQEQSANVVEKSKAVVAEITETSGETVAEAKEVIAKSIDKAEVAIEKAPEQIKESLASVAETLSPDNHEASLAIAKKSGCLACHSVEKNVVGPAWKDVAARYKDDAAARENLISKVSKGGSGNWTEVSKGVPMPPYSPRVTDENIAKLVDFVLSL